MELRTASAGVSPAATGTRSSTDSGTAGGGGGAGPPDAAPPRPERRQPEVVAQGRAVVVGAEGAALLQEWNDFIGEPIETAGRDVRHQDEAVAHPLVDELFHLVGDG